MRGDLWMVPRCPKLGKMWEDPGNTQPSSIPRPGDIKQAFGNEGLKAIWARQFDHPQRGKNWRKREGCCQFPDGESRKKEEISCQYLRDCFYFEVRRKKRSKGETHSEKKAVKAVLWLESQGKECHFSMMSFREQCSGHLSGQQHR